MAGNLEGNLFDIGIFELFQLLMNSRATGVLNIKCRGISFKVFFENGLVVAAESKSLKGTDALMNTIFIESGYFEFVKQHIKKTREIGLSMESLIADLFEKREQWREIKKVFTGGLRTILTLLGTDKSEIFLNKKEFRVASLVDGKRTIREISEESGIPDFEVARTLYDLYERGLASVHGVKEEKYPVEPVKLKVGLIRNLLEGEDGVWMSRMLGMAPRGLIDEFENDHVVWLDVKTVAEWEKKLNRKIFSVIATTPQFDNVILPISPQIALEDNIVFHENLRKN